MNGVGSSDKEYWHLISSCAGSTGQDKSVINRIMPRFRPIAPKPATCPDVPGGLTSDKSNLNDILPKGRRKRKYVRVRKYTRKKLPKSSSREAVKPKNVGSEHHDTTASTTLQLLPERSDLNRPMEFDLISNSCCSRITSISSSTTVTKESGPLQSNRGLPTCWISNKPVSDGTRMSDRMLVLQSWVTVECVTATSISGAGLGLGSTDVEKVMNLERDTCPGFVSDGSNSVMWVNGAFKRMVSVRNNTNHNDGLSPEIVVGLVIKESFPSFYSAFTGHVKLQYAVGVERHSRIVPCDLWRMDGGGFAWRLDVEAALTLGR